jgi:hypothetical protein
MAVTRLATQPSALIVLRVIHVFPSYEDISRAPHLGSRVPDEEFPLVSRTPSVRRSTSFFAPGGGGRD